MTTFERDRQLFKFLSKNLTKNRLNRFDKVVNERTKHFVAVVEDIYNERNASAVIRTCDCFGIQEINIIENYNKYTISKKIAKGAENWLDINLYENKVNNTQQCLNQLKNRGYQIVCTSPSNNAIKLSEFDISKKSAIVFGGEKNGLTKTALKNADVLIKIPMIGFSQSLNISVAAAIIFYQIIESLKKSNINWKLSKRNMLKPKINWALNSIPNSNEILKRFNLINR